MKTIEYRPASGQALAVEVNEETALLMADLERKEQNRARNARRRKELSADFFGEGGFELPDKAVDIEAGFLRAETVGEVRKAIKTLTPEQRELVYKIFYEEQDITAVAAESGVTRQAVQNRLKKIFAKLRKKF
jgi:RNA polymerase sigma factor (sigma-70 family)